MLILTLEGWKKLKTTLEALCLCNLSIIISSETSLKNKKSVMEYMNKELDDMSKEFYGLKSQFAPLENLVGQISDKQSTLVNKMAAKIMRKILK